jgi:hypothetical protein
MSQELMEQQQAAKKAKKDCTHTIHGVSLQVQVDCSCGYSGPAKVQQFPSKAEPTCPSCGATEKNDTGKPITKGHTPKEGE